MLSPAWLAPACPGLSSRDYHNMVHCGSAMISREFSVYIAGSDTFDPLTLRAIYSTVDVIMGR
jgi:hypothetical protein